jgi:hypothetical protein
MSQMPMAISSDDFEGAQQANGDSMQSHELALVSSSSYAHGSR